MPISDNFTALTGRQEPHRISEFPGSEEQGDKAVALAGRVGRRSMPWQSRTLFAMLRIDEFGMWTHPDVVLIVPRQNGKTLIVILRLLFGLFVLNERIVYTAQRWKSAEDAHNRLWEIIRKRPSLLKRVTRHRISAGDGFIELSTGGKIAFCTRSADAGRGLDEVDLIVYDEAYNLTEAETSALNPTQLASNNPQTIYTSSPVNADQHPNGYVLSGLRDQGYAGEIGLLFIEYMAPEEMPREDPATWRYANPSYGVIQSEAKVRKLLRTASTAAGRKSFDVEVLGRGDYPVALENLPALISAEIWKDMENPTPALAGPIALAVDMTPDRKWVSITAAQWTADGAVHLEVGHHAAPTPQTVPYIVALLGRMDPCVLVIDRASPAASLAPELLAAGVEATLTGSLEMAQACGLFYDQSIGGQLGHTGDPLLAEAVEGLAKRDMQGGGWAWDRKGRNVISPAVAASLALWGLTTFGASMAPEQTIVHLPDRQAPKQFRSESNLAAVGF